MLYRAFRYGTYLPSRYPVPPFLGSNGLGLISKRTFITTSTRKTLTLKDTHPDLVILGIGIGLAGVSILQSKKQKSSDVKFSSAVRHLLPNNFQDEEIKWLLQVLQHVPFDNFDTALANLAAIGSSEPSNLKTLLRVDGISLQSTSPSYLSAASMEIALPGYHFHGQGIFEGQKGPAMSEMLFTKLFPVLASAMHVYLNEQDGNSLSPEEIMTFIKKTFVAIDHIHVLFKLRDIFEAVKDHATSRAEDGDEVIYTVPLKTFSKKDAKALADACSASTALVALYNDLDCSLYVARTGSGRAILGRRVKDPGGGTRYKYETRILLAEDDPDDGHVRIFGNAPAKWHSQATKLVHDRYLGPPPSPEDQPSEGFLQEKYTAEPTIVRFPDVQRGDFVVLGSQGLWECLDNEQVVGLVGHWLEEQGIKEIVGDSPDTQREVIVPWTNRTLSQFAAASPFLKESTFNPEDLPVIYPEGYQDRTRKYKSWKAEKRFISVARDLDVASHVARNALGGADRELAEALYQIGGDVGKQLRDDIYVCVLFFG